MISAPSSTIPSMASHVLACGFSPMILRLVQTLDMALGFTVVFSKAAASSSDEPPSFSGVS